MVKITTSIYVDSQVYENFKNYFKADPRTRNVSLGDWVEKCMAAYLADHGIGAHYDAITDRERESDLNVVCAECGLKNFVKGWAKMVEDHDRKCPACDSNSWRVV